MPIDLSTLDQKRSRWLSLTGHLRGVDLLIAYASPSDMEKFRQKLIRAGITKASKEEGWQINHGRESDFFRMFAEQYVLDWRGDIHANGSEGTPPYDPTVMGRVLGAYKAAFEQLNTGIMEDADFFEQGSSK